MNQDQQLFRQLRRAAASAPSATAFAGKEIDLTFSELFDVSARAATWLLSEGISSSDRVMVDLSTDFAAIVSLALMQLGCTSAAIQDKEVFVRDGFTKLITSQKPGWLSDSQALIVENSFAAKLAFTKPLTSVAMFEPSEPVRILYSSGTTGLPKGVLFTEEVLKFRIAAAQNNWIPAQPFLCMLSFSSGSGFIAFLAQLQSGHTYISPGFAPENYLAITKHKVRSIKGSPIQLRRLLEYCEQTKQAISTLETIQSAGSFLSLKVAQALREKFTSQIVNLYGATELGTVAKADYFDLLPGEVGDLVPEIEAEVVTSSSQVSSDGSFLIKFKGDGLATGYAHPDPQDNAGMIQGWFVPGDLGTISKSKRVTVVGRESEVINIGGVKLSSAALSEQIQSLPGITEAITVQGESNSGEPVLVVRASPKNEHAFSKVQKYLLETLPPGVDFEILLAEVLDITITGKLSRNVDEQIP